MPVAAPVVTGGACVTAGVVGDVPSSDANDPRLRLRRRAPRSGRVPRRARDDGAHDHVHGGLRPSHRTRPVDASLRPGRGHASAAGCGVPRAVAARLAGVQTASARHCVRRALRGAAGRRRRRASRRSPGLGPADADRRLPDRPLGRRAVASPAGRCALSRAAGPRPGAAPHGATSSGDLRPARRVTERPAHRPCHRTLAAAFRPVRSGHGAAGHLSGRRPPPHGSSLTRRDRRMGNGRAPIPHPSLHSRLPAGRRRSATGTPGGDRIHRGHRSTI